MDAISFVVKLCSLQPLTLNVEVYVKVCICGIFYSKLNGTEAIIEITNLRIRWTVHSYLYLSLSLLIWNNKQWKEKKKNEHILNSEGYFHQYLLVEHRTSSTKGIQNTRTTNNNTHTKEKQKTILPRNNPDRNRRIARFGLGTTTYICRSLTL